MADKRPKTLRGGTSAEVCVGCPMLGERLRHEVGWGGSRIPEDGGGSPRGGGDLSLCVGGCLLTGAERSGVDELVRLLDDAVRPKLYYACVGMLTHIYVCLRKVKPDQSSTPQRLIARSILCGEGSTAKI